MRFGPEAQARFLLSVARTGQLTASAVAVGVARDTVRLLRKADKAFDEQVEQALDQYRDWIDAEIRRRGVEGVVEPIFYQGHLVGWIQKFSDQLAIAHAKAHDPRYRDRASVDVTMKGGVMVVPSAPTNPADWQTRFSQPSPQ